MVVPVDPTPVVLVVGAVVDVVVVVPLFGAVVEVVLVDVEVEVDAVVLVLVVVLVVVLVLVVVEVVVVGAGVGTKRFFNVGAGARAAEDRRQRLPGHQFDGRDEHEGEQEDHPGGPGQRLPRELALRGREGDGPGSWPVCSPSGTIGSVSTSPDVDVDVEATARSPGPEQAGRTPPSRRSRRSSP